MTRVVIRDVTASRCRRWTQPITNDERLAAAHATLTDAVAEVATSEDWQNLLRISGSFHRYSPNNQLLLAAQGADGLVARSTPGSRSPATDGQVVSDPQR